MLIRKHFLILKQTPHHSIKRFRPLKHLEVWADSFHEGEWLLKMISHFFGDLVITYLHNFQPHYTFSQNGVLLFDAIVYGSYGGWEPIPKPIEETIGYGKPDIMLFDRSDNRVFFAVEETAAVPTGNQSLQRLERVWFAAEQSIPFVYLVSEYGMHSDGGARRTSIWPSYLALKISSQYRVPSLTLLYGDNQHPEDYEVGTGVRDLADITYLYVREWLGENVAAEKAQVFRRVFSEMGDFILNQVDEISPQLPGRDLLTSEEFLSFMAMRIAYE
jgi:hypothetical protein